MKKCLKKFIFIPVVSAIGIYFVLQTAFLSYYYFSCVRLTQIATTCLFRRDAPRFPLLFLEMQDRLQYGKMRDRKCFLPGIIHIGNSLGSKDQRTGIRQRK